VFFARKMPGPRSRGLSSHRYGSAILNFLGNKIRHIHPGPLWRAFFLAKTGPCLRMPRSSSPSSLQSRGPALAGFFLVVPIARRQSILALTATLGLVLIVTGGTLGYRWTHPHIGEEVSEPSQQDRVPPPTTSPRSLPTRPAPSEHVVQIASQRSEADVLAVFRRLQQEQPALFSQATLSRIDLGPQSYSARVGPFASEKDAAAACLALAAADIRCF
jgi:hypothetical protein